MILSDVYPDECLPKFEIGAQVQAQDPDEEELRFHEGVVVNLSREKHTYGVRFDDGHVSRVHAADILFSNLYERLDYNMSYMKHNVDGTKSTPLHVQ